MAAAILRPPVASSLSMSSGVMFGAAVPLLPVMLITGRADALGTPINALIPLLAAIIVNCVGYVLFFEVVRMAGPTFFSQFSYLAIFAGIAWSSVVLGERPSIYLFVAMALMFFGMFIAGYQLDAISSVKRTYKVSHSPLVVQRKTKRGLIAKRDWAFPEGPRWRNRRQGLTLKKVRGARFSLNFGSDKPSPTRSKPPYRAPRSTSAGS